MNFSGPEIASTARIIRKYYLKDSGPCSTVWGPLGLSTCLIAILKVAARLCEPHFLRLRPHRF